MQGGESYNIGSFDQKFWLQIMSDHMLVLIDGLNPKQETNRALIQNAKSLREKADTLYRDLCNDKVTVQEINRQSLEMINEIFHLKSTVLEGKLEGKVDVSVSATYVSHMMNELKEYRSLFDSQPSKLSSNQLWTLDTEGHIVVLLKGLDDREYSEMHILLEMEQKYTKFFREALEYNTFYNHGARDTTRNDKLCQMAIEEGRKWINILDDMLSRTENKTLLSTVAAWVYDHMRMEYCYFMFKLGVPLQNLPYSPIVKRIDRDTNKFIREKFLL